MYKGAEYGTGSNGSGTGDDAPERNAGEDVEGIGGVTGTPHDGLVANTMHKLDKRLNVELDKKHNGKDMPLSTMKEAAAKGIRGLYRQALKSGDKKTMDKLQTKFGPKVTADATITGKQSVRQMASIVPVTKPSLRRHRGIKLGEPLEKSAVFRKMVSRLIPRISKKKSAGELVSEFNKKRALGIKQPKLKTERT